MEAMGNTLCFCVNKWLIHLIKDIFDLIYYMGMYNEFCTVNCYLSYSADSP